MKGLRTERLEYKMSESRYKYHVLCVCVCDTVTYLGEKVVVDAQIPSPLSRPRSTQQTLTSRLIARVPVESVTVGSVQALLLARCDSGRRMLYSSKLENRIRMNVPLY